MPPSPPQVTFGPLQGFLNGVVYGVNTKVLVLFRERFCPWLRMPTLTRCCGGGGDHKYRSTDGGFSDRTQSFDSDATFDERLLSDVNHADEIDDLDDDLHDSHPSHP